MKTNRIVVKSVSKKSAPSRTPVKPMNETGSNFGKKASRDTASPKARYGKKAPLTATSRSYGGEVVLEAKLTPAQKEEILGIVRNSGKKGPRNPDERVIKITDKPGKLVIATAGGDLAVAIGKAVHHSHKGGKLTITWATSDVPVRVLWKK